MSPDVGPVIEVGVYCRVSSDEQALRETIQLQVEFAKRHSELAEAELVDFFLDNGVSGTVPLDERPEGARLLADARKGRFKQVWFYRLDRLGRSGLVILQAHEQLKQAGVTAKSLTEPFDTSSPFGEFVLGILAMVAGYDRAAIIERTGLGRRRRALAGRWPGGQAPLGYRVSEGQLVIDEQEAEWVRRIFALSASDGLGTERIATRLNDTGTPTAYVHRRVQRARFRGLWRGPLISRVLRNETYTGTFRWSRKDRTVDIEVPAIVSTETFAAAQARLRTNSALASRGARHDYLLKSIRCGHCGNVFVGHHSSKANGRYEYRNYVCVGKGKNRVTAPCPSRQIRADAIEEAVWSDIEGFVRDPGEAVILLEQGLLQSRSVPTEGEIQRIERLLAGKETERARVISFLRRGLISEPEAELELAQVQRESVMLRSRKDELVELGKDDEDQKRKLLSAGSLLESLRQRLSDADLRTKQEVLRTLVREITVTNGEIRVIYAFPSPAASVSASSPAAVVLERHVQGQAIVRRVQVVAVPPEVRAAHVQLHVALQEPVRRGDYRVPEVRACPGVRPAPVHHAQLLPGPRA